MVKRLPAWQTWVHSGEAGMALPLVLLLLMALAVFGHGTLLLSSHELQASWAFRNLVRAEQASEIGLHLAFEVPSPNDQDRTPWILHPLFSGETDDGMVYDTGRRWLDEEFFLLESRGRIRGWEGERTMAWIGWSLYPPARMRALLSAMEEGTGVAPVSHGGSGVEALLDVPEEWDRSLCQTYLSTLGIPSPEPFPRQREEMRPSEPLGRAEWSIPGLGFLSGRELIRRSKRAAKEKLSQGDAVVRGERLDSGSAWNQERLGARGLRDFPDTPAFLGKDGDLELDGGRIFGLIITAGDLRLEGDAVFQGLALVGGDLVLEDDAKIQGLAKVRGNWVLKDRSSFNASGCPVLHALWGIPSLRKPLAFSHGVRLN